MFIGEEDITVAEDINVTLLQLYGTLELSTVLDFKGRLSSLLARGHKNVIINLSQLSFIDSSGLTALVVSERDFSRQGGVLLIASLSSAVVYTFEITMMENILTIYPTQEEAIQHFCPPQDDG